jgi:hypothetical protein
MAQAARRSTENLRRILPFAVALWLSISAGCLHRRGAEMVAFTNQNKLMVRGDCRTRSKGCAPLKETEADLYASEQYDSYKESGFVTLKPNMQLRVVAPVMRPGSKADAAAVASDGAKGSSGEISLRASGDLTGYETALYSLRANKAGSVSLRAPSINLEPIGKHNQTDLTQTDYLASIKKPCFLRLYFQLRHAPASHPQVLLVSDGQGELNEASGQFEPVPDAYCAAVHPHARCIVFPQATAVNAEIRVFVRRRAVYVPLSATVSDALVSAGIADPKDKLRKLKIKRVWDGHPVRVTFDRDTTPILGLTLSGDDHITF